MRTVSCYGYPWKLSYLCLIRGEGEWSFQFEVECSSLLEGSLVTSVLGSIFRNIFLRWLHEIWRQLKLKEIQKWWNSLGPQRFWFWFLSLSECTMKISKLIPKLQIPHFQRRFLKQYESKPATLKLIPSKINIFTKEREGLFKWVNCFSFQGFERIYHTYLIIVNHILSKMN